MVAPVPIPENYFRSARFDLQHYVSTNTLVGGRTQVRQQADPRWVARYTTAQLNELQKRRFRSFWNRMKGGLIPFLAYDPAQEYPYNFPNGFTGINRAAGGAFDGTATVTGLSSTTISVSGLPSVFPMTDGDFVSLIQNTELYGLFQLTSDAIASGGSVSMNVEPPIKTSMFTTAATANFARPACVMIPLAESWSYEPDAVSFPGASWEAIQKPF